MDAQIRKGADAADALNPGLRQCVHEYGAPIVNACLQAGVRDPRRIHNLVREVWDGARQHGQRNYTGGTPRNAMADKIDWLLLQAGAEISAQTLVRILYGGAFVILPLHPSERAVEASMATVSNFDRKVTKAEKHRLRLRAAQETEARKLWPQLFEPFEKPVIRLVPSPTPQDNTGDKTEGRGNG